MMNASVSPFPSPIGSPVSAARADQMVGLVDDLGTGYVRFDNQARIEQVNDVFASWASLPRDAMAGLHLSAYLQGDPCATGGDAPVYLTPVFQERELELSLPTGMLPVRVHVRAIADESGQAAGGYWLLQDLRSNDRQQREQKESQRLRALGALTAGIAHDFNNILTTVLGQAELMELRHGHTLHDDARQRLGRIERSGRQAASLVSQMLSFARQRTGQMARLDLGSVISAAVEVLRHGLPEDIHLRKDLRSTARLVWGNLSELQLAVVSLCLSIREEMPQGGTIVLRVEQSVQDDAHRGWLQMTVADAATDELPPGAEAARPNLRSPRFTEVAEILAAHGGSVGVQSPRRIVCLLPPFSNDETESDGLLNTSSLDPLKGEGRILLVEDDSAVAETTAQMLRSLGYEVVTAVLPSHALQIIRGQSRPFDLVVSDITMPEMNGYQLADEISRQFGPIPVLFVTGYDFNVSSGAISRVLLQKPLTLQRLGEGVRRVLASASSR